jgi:hypothetical protein
MKGDNLSTKGYNSERIKIHLIFFKKNLFQNQLVKFNQTWYKYPWVKGIQVCSNKGPGLLQRGDNHKNVKIAWGHLKVFLSRTTGPILN